MVDAWGLSEQKRREREKVESEDRAARYAAAAKQVEAETERRRAQYTKLEQDIKELRDLRLKMTPPTLSDGDLRVLREMAGDFTASEWTQYIDAPVAEIERACVWLGVQPQAAGVMRYGASAPCD